MSAGLSTEPGFDPEGRVWDVVIVGAGAGGATAGYALARRGRSVLFLERGKRLDTDPSVVRGVGLEWRGDAEAALRHGWWPEAMYSKHGPWDSPVTQISGCGTGGTTGVFGMVMDRFRPQDFEPRQFFGAMPESSVPEAWPITADTLAPYYTEAERLFRVKGTPDPLWPATDGLSPPPPPTPRETLVAEALAGCGLHPYRIHAAQDRVPECDGCPAVLCPRPCRNDAGRICLQPALNRHGAGVLTGCLVERLEESHRAVQRAVCRWQEREISVRGRVFVLAANAFFTPALLQRSASDRFPDGLANSSGLVGRNLMLHVSDYLLAQPRREPRGPLRLHHGIALNDFYVHGGTKLGNVHLHPFPVTREGVRTFIRMHRKRVNRLPEPVLAAGAAAAAYFGRKGIMFSTIVEDLPYRSNMVRARPGTPGAVEYEYRYPHELRERAWTLRERFSASIGQRFTVRPARTPGRLNVSHACGTCRFGDDPGTSVLDRDNRAHDLDNLYVVDASFFPSSGGINPSLTIVANSLRAAEQIDRRL
jgi:choline dehydrogenase-like flavoprotein